MPTFVSLFSFWTSLSSYSGKKMVGYIFVKFLIIRRACRLWHIIFNHFNFGVILFMLLDYTDILITVLLRIVSLCTSLISVVCSLMNAT